MAPWNQCLCHMSLREMEMEELTTCNCKESRCATGHCVFRKVCLSCTAACSCEADDDVCDNCESDDDHHSMTDDSDSDDE